METISRYRQIITRVLSDLAEASARDDVEVLPLFDVAHDNYLLIDAGWRGVQRIHHIIAHLRIYNGKIWVEADNTDAAIVQQLLDSGISKAEIVLAFHSPQKRPYTEFAVA
jgi:hypothetical protein